ncbi:MAG: YicC/YloC family endoribonuclease [Candidatus Omnitrophota bacterium]
MIKGMSGFGQAESENSKFKATVQVHSLNHRYLDASVYLPEYLRSLDNYIKLIIKKKLKRGKVNVSINIFTKGAIKPHLNPDIVGAYVHLAARLNRQFGISKDIAFWQLLNLPSVLIEKEKPPIDEVEAKRLLTPLVNKALEKLLVMRQKEGIAIYKDLQKRSRIVSSKIKYIENKLPKVFERLKAKLSHEELGAFMRNCDVSEEIVRLKFHIANLCQVATNTKGESSGKELDFICQELQREANTLGAKVPDKYISFAVVKIKSQLEKLREQLQNVE